MDVFWSLQCGGVLADGGSLAGQRRFFGGEIGGRRQDTRIGRDAVSRLDDDDVARDEILCVDTDEMTVAQDAAHGVAHASQCRQRALGA